MNIFKRIWNYFFRKTKGNETISKDATNNIPRMALESQPKRIYAQEKPKEKNHSQIFRNHQLSGKVYNIGKSRFRIKRKIGEAGEKLKYHIELLI